MIQHLADARFHLRNAVRSLEAALDQAEDTRAMSRLQQLAAHTRKLVRALNDLEARRGKAA